MTPETAAPRRSRRTLMLIVAIVVLAVLVVLIIQVFTGCLISWPSEMEHQQAIQYVEPPREAAPEAAVAFGSTKVLDSLGLPPNPVTPTPQSVVVGATRFQTFCRLCHGEPGRGPGEVGALFKPPPPDLALLTPALPDGQIYQVITRGFGRMPALYSRMVSTDRWDIVNYLRSVAPSTLPVPAPATSATLRALATYAEACAGCHGATAQGGFGPGLRPDSFIEHSLTSEVADVIRIGRQAQGMPAFGLLLSPIQIDELARLLKQLQTPEGASLLHPGATTTMAPTPSTTSTTSPATTTTTGGTTTTTTGGGSTTTTSRAGSTTTTAANLAQGLQVFNANCQGCHGANGAGGIGPKLRPNAFITGSPEAAVVATVENGRPGTPMPAWKGRLSPAEIAAVVGLLESWQGKTTGASTSGEVDGYPTLPFTHQAHVSRGVACIFCHSAVLQGPAADVPPLQLCAGCHRWLTFQSAQTREVVAAYDKGVTVAWKRTTWLPDFVYFPHQTHVVAGKVECAECHGDVAQMQLDVKVKRLNMGFCISCHRRSQAKVDQWAAAGRQPYVRLLDCGTCHK